MDPRLKSELEEINISHEGTLAALRMKHNNTMAELGEQIDGLNSNKVKAEKDKANMERDLQETRQGLEEAVREKAELDRHGKLVSGNIADSHAKLDELARALNEADSQKKRLDVEKMDLGPILQSFFSAEKIFDLFSTSNFEDPKQQI
jgi:myosin protein heavy chain